MESLKQGERKAAVKDWSVPSFILSHFFQKVRTQTRIERTASVSRPFNRKECAQVTSEVFFMPADCFDRRLCAARENQYRVEHFVSHHTTWYERH